eukprot:417288-Pyramimonas_sp.AAC.1
MVYCQRPYPRIWCIINPPSTRLLVTMRGKCSGGGNPVCTQRANCNFFEGSLRGSEGLQQVAVCPLASSLMPPTSQQSQWSTLHAAEEQAASHAPSFCTGSCEP